LQLAHLVLQGPVFGGGQYFLAGPNRRQRALGIQPPPSEHLVGAIPCCRATGDTDIPGA
jgi:hypothetical protein